MDSNLMKLEESFRSGLGLPKETSIKGLKYRDIQQWDSVGHMQLIAQIESDFDIMLDTTDVVDLSSFERAIFILTKYGVLFEPAT